MAIGGGRVRRSGLAMGIEGGGRGEDGIFGKGGEWGGKVASVRIEMYK